MQHKHKQVDQKKILLDITHIPLIAYASRNNKINYIVCTYTIKEIKLRYNHKMIFGRWLADKIEALDSDNKETKEIGIYHLVTTTSNTFKRLITNEYYSIIGKNEGDYSPKKDLRKIAGNFIST